MVTLLEICLLLNTAHSFCYATVFTIRLGVLHFYLDKAPYKKQVADYLSNPLSPKLNGGIICLFNISCQKTFMSH